MKPLLIRSSTAAVVAGLLLGGCEWSTSKPGGENSARKAVDDRNDAANALEWFEGTLDEAFVVAAEQQKPVYLYWTARWCPPCHALQANLFRSAEFVERSRQFIAVYLDGDTEHAQEAGEAIRALGYPTTIVFAPGGHEFTRIPGSIDTRAYVDVLDLALQDVLPADRLVIRLVAGETGLSSRECSLLAYYSWNQSPSLLDGLDEAELYRSAYDGCPAEQKVERTLLFMNYLDALIENTREEAESSQIDRARIVEARAVLDEVLNDAPLLRANAVAITFNGASMARELTQPGSSERESLIQSLNEAMDAIAADPAVFKRERVYASLGKLYLARIEDPDAAPSEALRNEIVAMASWADRHTSDPVERQAVISAVSNVLLQSGLYQVARPLLLDQLERSREPYYFMVPLAEIEEAQGNADQALYWLKKAYDTSRGPATRFQWGYYYLVGLMDLSPEQSGLIRKTTLDVLRELEDGSGFYQRPKAQLIRLEKRLLEWGRESRRSDTLSGLRDDVLAVCENFAGRRESFETCRSFLESA